MARIRTIKPQFWTDEKLAELPRDVRLLFLGLISAMADDAGRCKGHARLVRAAVFPMDDDITGIQVEEWLQMLHRTGRIQLYEVNGERYVQVVNWQRHQRIDKPQPSHLPGVDGSVSIPRQFQERSENVPRTVEEPSTLDVEVEVEKKRTTPLPPVAADAARSRKRKLTPTPEEAAVLAHYVTTHPKRRPGDDETRVVRRALGFGYTVGELCRAITGNARDPWHRDRRKHELDYVLRKNGTIDNFIAKADALEEPTHIDETGETTPYGLSLGMWDVLPARFRPREAIVT